MAVVAKLENIVYEEMVANLNINSSLIQSLIGLHGSRKVTS